MEKKTYEFTRSDESKVLDYVTTHLSEALEGLRAYRMIMPISFDKLSRFENESFWSLFSTVLACRRFIVNEIDPLSGGITLFHTRLSIEELKGIGNISVVNGDYLEARRFYVAMANKIISGEGAAIDSTDKE